MDLEKFYVTKESSNQIAYTFNPNLNTVYYGDSKGDDSPHRPLKSFSHSNSILIFNDSKLEVYKLIKCRLPTTESTTDPEFLGSLWSTNALIRKHLIPICNHRNCDFKITNHTTLSNYHFITTLFN